MGNMTFEEIQSIFSNSNRVYKIQSILDLAGNTLIIPNNCTLIFDGGSFNNGTIQGNDTYVVGAYKGCLKVNWTGLLELDGNTLDFGKAYSNDNIPSKVNVIGTSVFNTTLNKPVWWTGTQWVDATGASV